MQVNNTSVGTLLHCLPEMYYWMYSVLRHIGAYSYFDKSLGVYSMQICSIC